MNKLLKISLLFFCFLLGAGGLQAQKVRPKAAAAAGAQTKVDLGKLRANTYTNDFFELKIEFPFGWLVGDNMLEAQLMAIKQSTVTAKSAKDQRSLDQAMKRVTPLLGGYKSLPGSVAENSSLRVVVENLAANPKIKTGRDYLNAMFATLKITQLPAGFSVSDVKNETLDGQTIGYVETKYLTSHKRTYVYLKKGFAILISIDSYGQQDFDALHQVLAAADLDYKE
jgi:hypothetical protein